MGLLPSIDSLAQSSRTFQADCPADTFAIGESIAESLDGGDTILLYGGLGAGKTLLTKGIMNALGFDVDEVTSPSFTLVNLYKTIKFDVYHVDLWRLDSASNPAGAVGLEEILENENTVAIIEWADRLGEAIPERSISIKIEGDGDEPRKIVVKGYKGLPIP
jgi:tRNA threonylcarbamoyl adenosine modification protein YjeE